MLDVLHKIEKQLPELLANRNQWKSLDINYHPPRVERLWTQVGKYRVYLHKIHPCDEKDALFHPHPWPSAMRILEGQYEMGISRGEGEVAPPVACKVILAAGNTYEMTDFDGWHYVRPLTVCYTVMIAGELWGREFSKPDKKLYPLSDEESNHLFEHFPKAYSNLGLWTP